MSEQSQGVAAPPGLPAYVQALLQGGAPMGALAQLGPLLGGLPTGGLPGRGGAAIPQPGGSSIAATPQGLNSGFGVFTGGGLVQGGQSGAPPTPWTLFTGR